MHLKVKEALAASGVSYKVFRHQDAGVPIESANDAAEALGYALERITKSILLVAGTSQYAIAVCSTNMKARFTVLSRHLGWKRLEVAARAELASATGFPSMGVSPLGLQLPTFMDRQLLNHSSILVGAGEAGVEVEISPRDLVELTSAVVLEFAQPQ